MTTIETTEVQYRTFEVREVDTETRTFEGLAVPYNTPTEINGYREMFVRGAFGEGISGPLYFGHDHRQGGMPVGKIVEARESDEGLHIKAKISKTTKGDDAYTLLRDGAVQSLSVGFTPIESRMEDDVLVRTAAKFLEVSLTPFSAYETAKVAEVRSADTDKQEETPMETTMDPNADLSEIRESITDIERRITVLSDDRGGEPVSQFRSAGEILKALASGDERAQAEFRDFGTMADADVTRPGWIQRPLKFVQEKRRVINLFSRGPLPPTGNTVEYPYVDSVSGTVAEQEDEGDALAYMEVALTSGTSPVKTYGGYSSLSRQAIERSDLAYLDAVLRYQALQYAKATETAARTALLAMTGTGTGTLASDDAQGWIDVVIDAAADIEDDSLGLTADFILVGRDVFKSIAHMVDDAGRPIFALNGDGQNTVGSANLVRGSFQIAGLTGVVDPTLPAETAIVASAEAFTVLESPGAPFRLQDESIINLTKDFSLYGYMATVVNDAKGVVVLDVDLTP